MRRNASMTDQRYVTSSVKTPTPLSRQISTGKISTAGKISTLKPIEPAISLKPPEDIPPVPVDISIETISSARQKTPIQQRFLQKPPKVTPRPPIRLPPVNLQKMNVHPRDLPTIESRTEEENVQNDFKQNISSMNQNISLMNENISSMNQNISSMNENLAIVNRSTLSLLREMKDNSVRVNDGLNKIVECLLFIESEREGSISGVCVEIRDCFKECIKELSDKQILSQQESTRDSTRYLPIHRRGDIPSPISKEKIDLLISHIEDIKVKKDRELSLLEDIKSMLNKEEK